MDAISGNYAGDSSLNRFGEYFMYFTIGFWLLEEMLVGSNLEYVLFWKKEAVNDVFAVIVLVLLLVQLVFFQSYEKKDLILLTLISLLTCISTLTSGHNVMLSTCLFVFASKNIRLDRLIKVVFFVLLISFTVVFYMYFSGGVQETISHRGVILRHSYGFVHANFLGIQMFHMFLCGFFLRRNRIGVIDYLALLAGVYFVYKVPNSQSSYYALFVFLVLMVLYSIVKNHNTWRRKLSNCFVVAAVAINVFSVFMSTRSLKGMKVLSGIDRFLSHRFSNCYKTCNYFGIHLFGQEIKTLIVKPGIGRFLRLYLDNGYMAILLRYGVLLYLLFSIGYIYTMIRLRDQDELFLQMVFFIYAVYGVMENNFFSISQNIFLATMARVIYLRTNQISTDTNHMVRLKFVL